LGGRIYCSCKQPERDEVTNGLRGLEHGGDDAERREYRQAGEPLDPAAQDARYLRDLLTKVARVRRRLARKLKETAVVAPRQPELPSSRAFWASNSSAESAGVSQLGELLKFVRD
jgi:hypothetical protein